MVEFLLKLVVVLLLVDLLLQGISFYLKLTEKQPASFLEIFNLIYDQNEELKRNLDEIKDETVKKLIENHLKTQDLIKSTLDKMKKDEKDNDKKIL